MNLDPSLHKLPKDGIWVLGKDLIEGDKIWGCEHEKDIRNFSWWTDNDNIPPVVNFTSPYYNREELHKVRADMWFYIQREIKENEWGIETP